MVGGGGGWCSFSNVNIACDASLAIIFWYEQVFMHFGMYKMDQNFVNLRVRENLVS